MANDILHIFYHQKKFREKKAFNQGKKELVASEVRVTKNIAAFTLLSLRVLTVGKVRCHVTKSLKQPLERSVQKETKVLAQPAPSLQLCE